MAGKGGWLVGHKRNNYCWKCLGLREIKVVPDNRHRGLDIDWVNCPKCNADGRAEVDEHFLWELDDPKEDQCCICDRIISHHTRVKQMPKLELRPTGKDCRIQRWWYCPECWEHMQQIRIRRRIPRSFGTSWFRLQRCSMFIDF